MSTMLIRLRPLLVGLVALLFTAGIAFAARPEGPPPGLAIAAEHAGKTVPVQAEEEESEEEAEEELEEEELEEEEPAEESEDAENCADDPTELTPEELADVRHGSVVCWAAHQETPEGYDNHGAWMSEWAKKNRGHDFGAEEAEDAGTVLPAAASGKAKGKSKND